MKHHYFVRITILIVIALLAACTAMPLSDSRLDAGDSNTSNLAIIKSPNDDREYRYLVLDNGLKVVLISDLQADKSAASLAVYSGSFDDPTDRPGLAHFLEHMLFIGTEKYPEPDGYFTHIQSHGGSSNAYTATEHTNYFFDVQPEVFPEALDRFAQFFISPLFQKEYVEREKNAVNSEYQLQIKEDGWRNFMVQKVAANPEHPSSTFNIGTLETLSGDVHGSLLKFFEENYSANRMGLVVLTNETLDAMEPWVTDIFAPIENRKLEAVDWEMPVFLPEQLPATLRHDNVRDQSSVSYVFPIPSLKPLYKKKPTQYLGNLLGHEGDGSLHKLLNSKGWINVLAAGSSMVDDKHSAMTVSIDLTETGAKHIPEISAYLFSYLDLLRDNEIEQWLYEEQATVARLGFQFSEKSRAISAVQSMAPSLEHYPASELLIAPYLMKEFDGELIGDFLSYLNKDNVLVTIAGPDYEGSKTEEWFGVSYDLAGGAIELGKVSNMGLSLPAVNPFLPETLTLIEADGIEGDGLGGDRGLPQLVDNNQKAEVYLDSDVEFGVPRAVTHVSIRNEGGLVDLEDVVRSQLYSALVQDDLNALAYPALLAGVSYQIASPPKGFRVSIGGYHDKQLVLLEEVINRLVNLEIDADRFAVLQNEILRGLDNAHREKPYLQSYQRLQNELVEGSYMATTLAEEIGKITIPGLAAWREGVFAKSSIQAMLIGNVTTDRAHSLVELLDNYLTIGSVVVAQPEVGEVSGINNLNLDIDHDDAAMVLFVRDESDSFEDRAQSALLSHLIAPAYFSSLRTEQQLGYVVFATNLQLREISGNGFVVQSPVVGPDALRTRTLEFIDVQVQRFAEMPDEEFSANQGGLVAKLTQKDKNLSQRATRYWMDLDRGVMTFDSNKQLAQQVQALSKDDMIDFLEIVKGKLINNYFMVTSEGKFASEG